MVLIIIDVKVNDFKFEDNKRKFMLWLINDDIIFIIGVYGFGGVGKIILFKEIYNELFENFMFFRYVYWVFVLYGIIVSLL